jgi:hypothetical protein
MHLRPAFALAVTITLASIVAQAAPQPNRLRQQVEALQASLADALSEIRDLKGRIAVLENNSVLTLNGALSFDSSTATALFSGVNVKIVNGAGQTDSINGLGNLVVGYDETNLDRGSDKSGSHNLVVGSQNNYSSYGGTVLGHRNTISGPYAGVTGGRDNLADGPHSSVTGGFLNEARTVRMFDSAPMVSGGTKNVALGGAPGGAPSISGGTGNRATSGPVYGSAPSIGGGSGNRAGGICASVVGGIENTSGVSDGLCSSILGGEGNVAIGRASVVVGGSENTVSGLYWPVIVGGSDNTAGGIGAASILGGQGQSLFAAGAGGSPAPTIPPIP